MHSYQSLLEVFDLLKLLETLKHLPRTISTMKSYVKAQLPLLKLRRQEVTITPQKQLTGGDKSAGRADKGNVYFSILYICSRPHYPRLHSERNYILAWLDSWTSLQTCFTQWRGQCRSNLASVNMREVMVTQHHPSF